MDQDDARRLVAGSGLTAAAVGLLTPLMADVPFEGLGAVKGLLKRFFSEEPWGADDDTALAAAVGPGDGSVDTTLAEGLRLEAGWNDGAFWIRLSGDGVPAGDAGAPVDLADSFSSGVIPEPTPNPRTLRFATAHRGLSQSVSYRRGDPVDDPAVRRVFAAAREVADVLLGPDFVAVSIDRPRAWPELLMPVLAAVAEGFGGVDEEAVVSSPGVRGPAGLPSSSGGEHASPGRASRLERAWAALGHLRSARAEDLALVVAATSDEEPARRQVAANLLREADPAVAFEHWAALVDDASRSVRRAAVDAIVDSAREGLRPLLERALRDDDGWVLWKAVHGLGDLGVGSSRRLVEVLRTDPDFRVRLEAAQILRAGEPRQESGPLGPDS